MEKSVEKTEFGVRTTHPSYGTCYSAEEQGKKNPCLAAVSSIGIPFA